MKNSADLGGCYPPRPSASVDNNSLSYTRRMYMRYIFFNYLYYYHLGGINFNSFVNICIIFRYI